MEPEHGARLLNEIITEIILHSFRYRVKSVDEWEKLHDIFAHLLQLGETKRNIYSKICYVCPEIMCWRQELVVTKFPNIEKVVIENVAHHQKFSWGDVLPNFPNLRNLKVIRAIREQVVLFQNKLIN